MNKGSTIIRKSPYSGYALLSGFWGDVQAGQCRAPLSSFQRQPKPSAGHRPGHVGRAAGLRGVCGDRVRGVEGPQSQALHADRADRSRLFRGGRVIFFSHGKRLESWGKETKEMEQ